MRNRADTRRVSSLVCAFAIAAAGGCAEETGLIITVSQGDVTLPPDTLELFIGVDDRTTVAMREASWCAGNDDPSNTSDTLSRFITDSDIAERVVDVSGRDLASDPYKLLMRKGEQLSMDEGLMAVVVAWKDEQIVGVGTLDAPVRFAQGNVLEWRVELVPVPQSFVKESDCVCAFAASHGQVVLVPSKDMDCDSVSVPADCNDQDPTIYPDAHELCDGIDNNCVDSDDRFPTSSLCLVPNAEGCQVGLRACDDLGTDGEPQIGLCRPIEAEANIASQTMCEIFDQCPLDAEQMDCAIEKVFTEFECTAKIGPNGRLCDGHSVYLGANADTAGGQCRWVLIAGLQPDGFEATMVSLENGAQPTEIANICRPIFTVLGVSELEIEDDSAFHLWQSVGAEEKRHVRLRVELETVAECSNDDSTLGFSCVGLDPALDLIASES